MKYEIEVKTETIFILSTLLDDTLPPETILEMTVELFKEILITTHEIGQPE